MFVVGMAEWGPDNLPTDIYSVAEYKRRFGDYSSDTNFLDDMYEAVKAFFAEGGTKCKVVRCKGTSDVKATKDFVSATITAITIAFVDSNPDTITDSGNGFVTAGFVDGGSITVSGTVSNDGTYTIATATAGTLTLIGADSLAAEAAGSSFTITQAGMTVTSKYYGALGNSINIVIEAGTVATTKKITVQPPSALSSQYEVFDNLVLTTAAGRTAATTRIDDNSKYVNLAAATHDPNAAAATALASGADDYATIDNTAVIGAAGPPKTGLQCFNDMSYGTGQVVIPGFNNATVWAAIKTHVEAYYRFSVNGPDAGKTLTTVQTDRGTVVYSFRMGYYWPLPRVPDEENLGQLKTINVQGSVCGRIAWNDIKRGPHAAPAGLKPDGVDMSLRAVSALEQEISGYRMVGDAENDTLLPLGINPLREDKGPLCIWGCRTMASSQSDAFIHHARLANVLHYELYNEIDELPFSTIDSAGKLFRKIQEICNSICKDHWRKGHFYGNEPGSTAATTDAWQVICDSTNNTADTLNNQELHALVGFKPSPTAEKIFVEVQRQSLGFSNF
jgi:hypothetical protein